MTARHQYGEPAFGGEVQILDFTAAVHGGAMGPSREEPTTTPNASKSAS
jgi:hypothetical protein